MAYHVDQQSGILCKNVVSLHCEILNSKSFKRNVKSNKVSDIYINKYENRPEY